MPKTAVAGDWSKLAIAVIVLWATAWQLQNQSIVRGNYPTQQTVGTFRLGP